MDIFNLLSKLSPETIVASGTTVALLYLLYTNRLRDKEWNKMLTNHLGHEQESRDKLTKALERLTSKINRLKK